MRLPRIKPVHRPERLPDGRIRIGTQQYGVGCEIPEDPDGNIWRLLGLMDGTRSDDELVTEMLQSKPGLDSESIREAIDTLIARGFVEDAGTLPPSALSSSELERYDRSFNYFAWVDIKPRPSPYELQRRLKTRE